MHEEMNSEAILSGLEPRKAWKAPVVVQLSLGETRSGPTTQNNENKNHCRPCSVS